MGIERVIAEGLAACGSVYGQTISKQQAEVYSAILANYQENDLRQAFLAHMRDPNRGQYFPKPADLIHQIAQTNPSVKQEALLAWAEVPRLLRNSRGAKSENPITERAVRDLGGWVSLGQKTEQELVWVAKEFAERYALHAQHGTEVEALTADRRILDGVAQIGRIH